jgi:chaperonin GroEL
LSGSVAAVKVGAITEAELKAKKERLEDALSAVTAALEEGIIPGGGVAFIRSIHALNELNPGNEDERTGINIIRKCLEGPLRALAQNAGLEGSVVLQKVIEGKDDFVYNIRNRTYENLLSAGVLDTTKVARVALQSAVSIAGSFLTMECAIAEEKVKQHNLTIPELE